MCVKSFDPLLLEDSRRCWNCKMNVHGECRANPPEKLLSSSTVSNVLACSENAWHDMKNGPYGGDAGSLSSNTKTVRNNTYETSYPKIENNSWCGQHEYSSNDQVYLNCVYDIRLPFSGGNIDVLKDSDGHCLFHCLRCDSHFYAESLRKTSDIICFCPICIIKLRSFYNQPKRCFSEIIRSKSRGLSLIYSGDINCIGYKGGDFRLHFRIKNGSVEAR